MTLRQATPRSLLALTLVLALGLAVVSCGGKDQAQAQRPGGSRGGGRALKFPVEVASVEARHVEFTVSAVGSIEAFETVQVTAQVAGVVERVLFREGDRVQAGQPLVAIEPERFELAVQSARAQLDRSKAEFEEAQAGLQRRVELNQRNPDLVKQEDIDAWRTRTSAAQATLAQAEAALRVAELNLEDAHAAAPLAGIIQTRDVQTGQYVQPGVVIATMVRRDPLLLRFTVPELEATRLRKGMSALFRVRGSAGEYEARITAVAESADPSTRMVVVTSEVTDRNREALRPGSFAEVTVNLGENESLPVIPQTAIRPSERGFLGFVVEDSTARERVLTLGSRTADGFVEVRSGMEPGEQVVVRGAEALRDGATVRVVRPEAAPDTVRQRTSG